MLQVQEDIKYDMEKQEEKNVLICYLIELTDAIQKDDHMKEQNFL
jgi:hypothetical protein